MSTKKQISESILFKLAGGYPTKSFPIHEEDIWSSLEQKINAKFAMKQFSVNLPSGETIPDNLALATYEDIVVTSVYSGKSKATLPVMPISLPKNAGINEIRPVLNQVPTGDKIHGDPMVQIIAGQDFLLKADTLLNDLLGQFGYTPKGRTIYFNKDLTTLNITKVDMWLVVLDMSQYGVNDLLPIPADYEAELEDELIQEFAPVVAKTGIVSNFTNPSQAPIKQ